MPKNYKFILPAVAVLLQWQAYAFSQSSDNVGEELRLRKVIVQGARINDQPAKPQKYYFRREDARHFKCRSYQSHSMKCNFGFRSEADPKDIEHYLASAVERISHGDASASCEVTGRRRNERVSCELIGEDLNLDSDALYYHLYCSSENRRRQQSGRCLKGLSSDLGYKNTLLESELQRQRALRAIDRQQYEVRLKNLKSQLMDAHTTIDEMQITLDQERGVVGRLTEKLRQAHQINLVSVEQIQEAERRIGSLEQTIAHQKQLIGELHVSIRATEQAIQAIPIDL